MTWELAAQWAGWLAPPLVGALIGWVTNALAIKMLFRPLRPWYIGPWRVPFTPGIIPRQRAGLARNVGRMVQEYLFSGEAVQAYLSRPETRSRFAQGLEGALTQAARAPLGRILSPSRVESLSAALSRWAESERFETLLTRFSTWLTAWFWNRSSAELLGPERWAAWETRLAEPGFWSFLNAPTKDVLSPGEASPAGEPPWAEDLVRLLEETSPSWTPILTEALHHPRTRAHLTRAGRDLLQKVWEQFSGFQRFFISAAQYDKSLDENMPALVQAAVDQGLRIWNDPRERAELLRTLVRLLLRSLNPGTGGEAAVRWWAPALSRGFSRLGAIPLGRVLENRLGWAEADFQAWLKEGLRTGTREGGARTAAWLEAHRSDWESLNAEDLLGLKPEDFAALAQILVDQGLAWAQPLADSLLAQLDLQALVENRVNSLDIAQVEALLLLVIKKHLGYINLIGALLGAVIGGVQLLL